MWSVQVRSFLRGQAVIAFAYDPPGGLPLEVPYAIERSERPLGPWTRLATDLREVDRFLDTTLPLGRAEDWWYRVGAYVGGEWRWSEATSTTHAADPLAQEMTLRYAIQLREFTGIEVVHYPRRRYGPKCAACYSEVRGKRTGTRCLACYDTGLSGGFLAPSLILLNRDPAPKTHLQSANGTQIDIMVSARTLPYPPLRPDDILLERSSDRWRIVAVEQTEKLRAPLRQTLTLLWLPVTEIEHALPLPRDVVRWVDVPLREHHPRTHLESFGFDGERA